ncbi:MAG: DUF4190 domain-containing protein [Verrucomicrobiota bacterium]
MYKIIGGDGRVYGPASADVVRQWKAEGRIHSRTQVMVEGGSGWRDLESYPEFASAPGSSPVPPAFATTAVPARSTHPLATTGLVLGIVALTFGMCCCNGFPFNLIGLVLSIIALSRIRSDPARYEGRGVAIAGIVLCSISIALGVLLALFWSGFAFLDAMHGGHRL